MTGTGSNFRHTDFEIRAKLSLKNQNHSTKNFNRVTNLVFPEPNRPETTKNKNFTNDGFEKKFSGPMTTQDLKQLKFVTPRLFISMTANNSK